MLKFFRIPGGGSDVQRFPTVHIVKTHILLDFILTNNPYKPECVILFL